MRKRFSDRGWEQFPHDADVGLRGLGPSIEVAFEQAALALTGIVTDAEIAADDPGRSGVRGL